MVRVRLSCAPRQSTVGGSAHREEVELGKVVELGITVAEERACGRVIAGGPVFVVEVTRSIHLDGGTPSQSPVR